MDEPFLCPICKRNRSDFIFVYKLKQEVKKDPGTGAFVFVADELELALRGDRRPDVDVICRACGYTAGQTAFARSAKREAPARPPLSGAGKGR